MEPSRREQSQLHALRAGGEEIGDDRRVRGLDRIKLVAEPRWFTITRHTFPVRDLPPELDGLRLVQLTDVHHGPWLSLDYVRQVVDAANALQPDLFLLTGDYVSDSPHYIPAVVGELARLRPRIGSIAVLGNHDYGRTARRPAQPIAETLHKT